MGFEQEQRGREDDFELVGVLEGEGKGVIEKRWGRWKCREGSGRGDEKVWKLGN